MLRHSSLENSEAAAQSSLGELSSQAAAQFRLRQLHHLRIRGDKNQRLLTHLVTCCLRTDAPPHTRAPTACATPPLPPADPDSCVEH